MASDSNIIAFKLAIALTSLTLSGVVVYWTNELRTNACGCSESWKREFLMWGYIVNIVLKLAILAIPTMTKSAKPFQMYLIASGGALALNVTLFATLLSYAVELERLKCKCSEGWKRRVAFIWPVVYFALLAMALLIALAIVISS